jgi:hypothetical protein
LAGDEDVRSRERHELEVGVGERFRTGAVGEESAERDAKE